MSRRGSSGGCPIVRKWKTTVSFENAFLPDASSNTMQPKAKILLCLLKTDSSWTSSGALYPSVPPADGVSSTLPDVPSDVRPKSVIFHSLVLGQNNTKLC